MVHRCAEVVRRARLAERVAGLVERTAECSADRDAARNADGAERVEAISVLHDLRLGGARRDACGVAVRLDRMADIRQQRRGIAGGFEETQRMVGGEPRGPGALWR